MSDPCDKGLTKDCFRLHPQWAKQAFAYRLLHTITPKRLSRHLPRAFRIPLIFQDAGIPSGVSLPPGLSDPQPSPQASLIIGSSGNMVFEAFPPGPPGPPGATSKSVVVEEAGPQDLCDLYLDHHDYSTYYFAEVDGSEPTDNNLETRGYWYKEFSGGDDRSKLGFYFTGAPQVINALRVYKLHNDTAHTWSFGRWTPIWVSLISGIEDVDGWSDIYEFANTTPDEHYQFRCNGSLVAAGQESWLYEIELYHLE